MLERVRERLLDHAVGGHLERAGQRARLSLDQELDVELALPRLGDEVGELGEIRLRRQLVGLVRPAQEAEQPVQLDDGLAARGLDRAQDLLRLLGLAFHHAPGGACLDAHHADVMRDDVVQLARDPHALLEHRAPGVLLPLPLELGRLRGQLALSVAS